MPWIPTALAVLLVTLPQPRPRWLSDSVVYLEQAAELSRWSVPSGRYPPGLPTLLALGDALGLGPGQVTRLVAIVLVLLIAVVARHLAGASGAAVAGLLCCASPWLLASGRYVMADPLAAVLALAALVAVLRGRLAAAGALAAVGVMARLFSGVGVLALVPVSRRTAVLAGVAASVAFGAFQWAASGSPLTTGYEDGAASWSAGYVIDQDRTGDGDWIVEGLAKETVPSESERDIPNIVLYPSVVLGVSFVFMPPFVSLAGLWELWLRRNTPAAHFTALWLIGSLAMALPYFFQSPRFLAPAMMLLVPYTAVGLIDLWRRARRQAAA